MEISQHRLHRLLEKLWQNLPAGRRPAYCYSRVIKVREGPDAGVWESWCGCPSVAFRLTSSGPQRPLRRVKRWGGDVLFLWVVNLGKYCKHGFSSVYLCGTVISLQQRSTHEQFFYMCVPLERQRSVSELCVSLSDESARGLQSYNWAFLKSCSDSRLHIVK